MANKVRQINRIPHGGRIQRKEVLRFRFDGKKYEGYLGDTLASALLANGVTLVGRSFKYHRPRGIFSAGPEEPNALVQLEKGAHTQPNRRATEIELYDGLVAYSQNRTPSLALDLGAVSSLFARILPAGFYYKTFMWPGSLWLWYEKWIRRAAGLGVSPTQPDPDYYDKLHAHCDVLVVGGGPAGLQAAYAAASSGARVMLVDQGSEFGGALLGEQNSIDGKDATAWVNAQVRALQKMEEVTLLPRTTLTGYYHYNFLVANQRVSEHLGPRPDNPQPRERLWKIRARQVVLATGSIERPLVFADNDRPGVMLASAVRTYLNRFGVLVGQRIVVLCNNDSAYHTAIEAKQAGAEVVIVDVRETVRGGLSDEAKKLGIAIHANHAVSAVQYKSGKIKSAQIMPLSPDAKSVQGAPTTVECDSVGVSGGWNPSVHLFSQSRGELKYCDAIHAFVPDKNSPLNPLCCAGACNGEYALAKCLAEGAAAGLAAAQAAGFQGGSAPVAKAARTEYADSRPLWILPCQHPIGRGRKKHFHELQNDATIADIALAAREGFDSVEHLKRYTTTGMGTDQGKTSNLNALAALAELQGVGVGELGVTTYRPPYTPLTFGAVVGQETRQLFAQQRTTPMHPCHLQHGAVFEDVGDWKRPYYYPSQGEDMHGAVHRECLAVRRGVGVLDASTLGKIDIRGKDAPKLLNMVYTNAWDKLAVGRCRYGLMLNEHGMVFDDGVTTRVGENHYHMTTTTGGAARVMAHLEEWLQTELPEAQVYCTSVTEQWAVASLNGPKSRELLAQICDQPLDDEAFPFMSMRQCTVAGIPARVFRISFSGELAFEINVPARFGPALWNALFTAGAAYELCPYGTEAMHVLRAEQGFIIVGQDTDGTVSPYDLGMNWIVSHRKADFVGKRSLSRSDTARLDRKQLVGLLSHKSQRVLPEGAHVVEQMLPHPPMKMLGHVSSSYFSPVLGRSIAMALVKDGFSRKNQVLDVALGNGRSERVTVTEPVFYRPH